MTPRKKETEDLIGMDEAIDLLKTSRPTFYRWLRAGKVKGMKVGRQWRFHRDDIDRFLQGEAPRIDLPVSPEPTLEILRRGIREAGGEVPSIPEGTGPMEEVIRLTIALGLTLVATDIHLTSHVDPDTPDGVMILRYTVHGALAEYGRIDRRLAPAIAAEWKRMASCNVGEHRKPQEGRLVMSSVDMRVFFTPAALGEMITVRILDPKEIHLDLDHLGFAPRDRERLQRAIGSPGGVVIVTGPTGSGKTTTIYSCLRELAGPERKIVTVEDPVECTLPWVTQVAVDDPAGVTHLSASRSLLRSCPHVLFVSEIRDGETASMVLHAGLTGHLVFTALHTESAAQALVRLVEAGVDPFVVGDATRVVVAQRLVRELCLECENAVGCKECRGTGYIGRTVMAEVLEVTPRIKKALRDGAAAEEIESIAVEEGMTTLAADGNRRATAGETTLDEITRVLGSARI